jgi:hypothetical protein
MCRGEKVVFYDFKGWKGSPWSERKLFSPEEEERIIKGVTEGGAVSKDSIGEIDIRLYLDVPGNYLLST